MLVEKAKKIVDTASDDEIELQFNYSPLKFEKGSYQVVIDVRKNLEELKATVKELEKEYNRKKASKALSNW